MSETVRLGEHVTREMEAGKVYRWDWLFKFDTQCVRLGDLRLGDGEAGRL